MAEVFKLRREGAGGFLNPPGDPAHNWSVVTYSSNRSNARVTGIAALDSVAEDDSYFPEYIREAARKKLAEADRKPSDLWIKMVYGYFRNCWTAAGKPMNAGDLTIGKRPEGTPDEYHAAVVHIRRWFPDHEPRTDLIADPGTGYSSGPCAKCGVRVQYEARLDALAVVTTPAGPGGSWSYNAECPRGGSHER